MQLDRLDAYEAAQVFGVYKLTKLDLTQVILQHRLMATPTYIDATSTPPMSPSSKLEVDDTKLEATGYVLATQSVDVSGSHVSGPHCEDETDEKLVWAHLSLSIEFSTRGKPRHRRKVSATALNRAHK
ncbi:hypothetical protein KXD40_009348 [Peronospora effusa]|uniref:Uncharacterized protein n=1 Tax=Peronospora effusa TaxID=542832 RepID=A0A3M6VNB4_9STRA|nr:hypothetical protein DD238_007667 [Peronospora effusa]RQM18795.1 hypothetical protein DD237_007998 [Peronospora effusa]UIZ28600.1 hypothetical protein KXD40_009348 [Peronospora effusa]CAI5729839.1 unnamed protein product [Peronospora effusa]